MPIRSPTAWFEAVAAGQRQGLCEGTAMPVDHVESRSRSTSVNIRQRPPELEAPVPAAEPAMTTQGRSSGAGGPSNVPVSVAAAVAAFHVAFDLPRQALPCVGISEDLAQLRVALLQEEVEEFVVATNARDLVGIADALADTVYVAYGAALTYGIDLDLVLAEVHRANMSKLDSRGQPVKRADGKVVKSERYRPPDVCGALQLQLPLHWPDGSGAA
jgi:predicted HAD superfamily Cof-like phosphohydrolase